MQVFTTKTIIYINNIFSNVWLNFKDSKIEIKVKPYAKVLDSSKTIDFESPVVLYKNDDGVLTQVDPSVITFNDDGTMTINDDTLVGKVLYGNIPEIVIDPNNAKINVEYNSYRFDKYDRPGFIILSSDKYNVDLNAVNYQLTAYPNTEIKYNISVLNGNEINLSQLINMTPDQFFDFFNETMDNKTLPFNLSVDLKNIDETPFYKNGISFITFNENPIDFDFRNSKIIIYNAVDFSSISVYVGPFILEQDANLYGTIKNLNITVKNANLHSYFSNVVNYYGDDSKTITFQNCTFNFKDTTAEKFAYLNGSCYVFDNCTFYLNKTYSDSIKNDSSVDCYINKGSLTIKTTCNVYDENGVLINLTEDVISK